MEERNIRTRSLGGRNRDYDSIMPRKRGDAVAFVQEFCRAS